uniref:Endoribonuclease L-PSP (Modular protein) n=1 Tax=mine drainage metagenome TaxID=410659 RepID=E6QK01_9ZZZZ
MAYRTVNIFRIKEKIARGFALFAAMLKSTEMNCEEKLAASGLKLPAPPTPGGNYRSAKRVGDLVYLAGAISANSSGIMTGTVGLDRTVTDGYRAAQACALTQLSVLKHELGTLDVIAEIISVNGYVNAVPGFEESPAVINGASDLLVTLLGEAGKHVRAAVGVCALPRNALVELQMTVRIEPQAALEKQ